MDDEKKDIKNSEDDISSHEHDNNDGKKLDSSKKEVTSEKDTTNSEEKDTSTKNEEETRISEIKDEESNKTLTGTYREFPPRSKKNKDHVERAPKKARRLVVGVVILILALISLVGGIGYHYVKESLQPLSQTSTKEIQVKIPIGSTNKEIGAILEKNHVIKSGVVFDYYVRTKKFDSFKAGYYLLKSSMTLTQIAHHLEVGGSSTPLINTGKVLVKEGVTAAEIGTVVQQNTRFSKKAFLKMLNNQSFINALEKKYPELLSSAVSATNTRYKLEGYLYPATYTVTKKTTLKNLILQMVMKTNQVISPYYSEISSKGYTVQKVLTLASLVEREGVTNSDRRKIAGVFLNRLDKNMMLQTDISVLYALNTSKTTVTYKDLKYASPYNLYLHTGVGPGPFNNPSLNSIKAVLDPADRDKDYLYFVANTKTGKVYYATTYAEHQANIKKIKNENSN
ncbi:endolytic transglycosylase MltG [Ligilactobacillus ubinensis]|uniref:endolytic transglycosylase MltG n=1 Tax=Ligilactobacillus ubinensis TaxID=2876789 RepID=UPI003CC574D8